VPHLSLILAGVLRRQLGVIHQGGSVHNLFKFRLIIPFMGIDVVAPQIVSIARTSEYRLPVPVSIVEERGTVDFVTHFLKFYFKIIGINN
jgi:hypothetical protein